MNTAYPYTCDHQIEKFTLQFMRVFSGFQVRDGVVRDEPDPSSPTTPKSRRIPVVYGNMERIMATVIQGRDGFKVNRIPMMAVNLSSIEPDMERKRNHHHVDSVTVRDRSGNVRGIDRIPGPSFTLRYELSIYASSSSELFSILEQILLVFNPRVTIQTSNDVYNSDYLSEISLDSINNEIQYPMSNNQQIVMMTLQFRVPIRLRYPYDPDSSYIDQIKANVFAIDSQGNHSIDPIDTLIIEGDLNP